MYSRLSSISLENYLFNRSVITWIVCIVFYLPLMLILFILWILQIPITIIINSFKQLLSFVFKSYENKASLNETISKINDLQPFENSEEISILSWNLFTFYGRFWTRIELIKPIIKSLNPDIICIQEAICSKWWNFGTINMINNLSKHQKCNDYKTYSVSLYDHLIHSSKVIFSNSFILHYFISEFQSLLNVYLIMPIFGKQFFNLGFKANDIIKALFGAFCGLSTQIGKCIVFKDSKNNNVYFKESLIFPGFADAMRALYLTTNNRKIWIVNTHLTSPAQTYKNDIDNDTQLLQTKMLMEWMNDELCQKINADLIIIAGDFNSDQSSNVYQLMIKNGYKSCLCDKYQNKQYFTYESLTWTLSDGIDEDHGKKLVLDYIWVKHENDNTGDALVIKECKLVGNNCFKLLKHKNKDIKVYPSDHYGIFLRFALNHCPTD